MKKLIVKYILPFLFPIMAFGQSDNTWLPGSTPTNTVIARNNFYVNGTGAPAGMLDTTGSVVGLPPGAMRVRPQDSLIWTYNGRLTGKKWSLSAGSVAGVSSVNGQVGAVVLTIPNNTNQLTNGAGFITAITAPVTSVNGQQGAVTVDGSIVHAAGDGTNILITGNGTVSTPFLVSFIGSLSATNNADSLRHKFIDITGLADGKTLVYQASGDKYVFVTPPSAPVTSVFGRNGTVAALSTDYAGFYYPLSGNPNGFLTAITGVMVTTALGYTPTNPNGTTAQYVRGNGTFATFPTIVSTFTNDAGYLASLSLSGDASGVNSGSSLPVTLTTVNANTGTFGSASLIPIITFDAKGRATAVSSTPIASLPLYFRNGLSYLSDTSGQWGGNLTKYDTLNGTASAFKVLFDSLGGFSIRDANTIAIKSSALFGLYSTTKGFLPPSMTTTQRNAISSPNDGLVVYDKTLHLPHFYDSVGATWVPWGTGGGGGGGGANGFASVRDTITLTSHGFTVGQMVHRTSSSYVLADLTTNNGPSGMVSKVIDANTFEITYSGKVTFTSGLTVGATAYQTTGGGITNTSPTVSIVIGYAKSSTEFILAGLDRGFDFTPPTLARQNFTSGTSGTVTAGRTLVKFDFAAPPATFNLTTPASPADQDIVELQTGITIAAPGIEITALTITANSGQVLNFYQSVSGVVFHSGETIRIRYNATGTYWDRIIN